MPLFTPDFVLQYQRLVAEISTRSVNVSFHKIQFVMLTGVILVPRMASV